MVNDIDCQEVRMKEDKLREWMFENHVSQRELADRLGISQASMSLFIRGLREPKLLVFKRICEVTGLEPRELW